MPLPFIPSLQNSPEDERAHSIRKIFLKPRLTQPSIHEGGRTEATNECDNMVGTFETFMTSRRVPPHRFVPSNSSYLSPPPRGTLPDAIPTPRTPGRTRSPPVLGRLIGEDVSKTKRARCNPPHEKCEREGAEENFDPSRIEIPSLDCSHANSCVSATKLALKSFSTPQRTDSSSSVNHILREKSTVALGSQQAAVAFPKRGSKTFGARCA